MTSKTTLEWRLARVAHEYWCERMIAEGWRPGPAFHAESRTHDAIVPFDELGPIDRRSVYLGVLAADCADEIRKVVDYSRGRDRELGVLDMANGQAVTHADAPDERGIIVAWAEDEAFPGALKTITVKWDSGETHQYAAAEREIVFAPHES
jgi:hypothetical protein